VIGPAAQPQPGGNQARSQPSTDCIAGLLPGSLLLAFSSSSAVPMSASVVPVRSGLHPLVGDPTVARSLSDPVPVHPGVRVTTPAPIARGPNIVSARPWDHFDTRSRWCYIDVDVDCSRTECRCRNRAGRHQ
jgi:hypothetical protein